MYKKILAPLDGSERGEAALPHAVEIAKAFEAELHLLRVVTPASPAALITPAGVLMDPSMGSAVEAEILAEAEEEEKTAAREYLDNITKRLGSTGLAFVAEVIEGGAATTILHYASRVNVDLIALSTHGRTGLLRMVMGSVADQVARQSGCPVLLVRSA